MADHFARNEHFIGLSARKNFLTSAEAVKMLVIMLIRLSSRVCEFLQVATLDFAGRPIDRP